jgi:protein-arginine kinase activator protein McsA
MCDICKKGEAIVFLTQVSQNEASQLDLCQDCASGLRIPNGIPLSEIMARLGTKKKAGSNKA